MDLFFAAIFTIIAAALGSAKGYSGALCGVAGFFGGLIAIGIIAFFPNRAEEQEEAEQRESAQNAEITALKNRIKDLEARQNAQAAPSIEMVDQEDDSSEAWR